MKTAIVIWLLALVVAVSGVLWISREIDRNVDKNGVGALYEGTGELPELVITENLDLAQVCESGGLVWVQFNPCDNALRVVNYYGMQDGRTPMSGVFSPQPMIDNLVNL